MSDSTKKPDLSLNLRRVRKNIRTDVSTGLVMATNTCRPSRPISPTTYNCL